MPTTNSPHETMQLAENIAQNINSPVCIALFGELGTGKTVFVKGLAKGLGIKDIIKSPTFVLMRTYSGRINLHHIDLYRIKKRDEILPFEEIIMDKAITAIEWAERAEGLLPDKRIEVRIKMLAGDSRKITINDYRN